jgi:hypothetical protein
VNRRLGGAARDAVSVLAQPAWGSPSETVSETVAVPGVAQVNVGFCAVALLSVPPVACHWKASGPGPASESWAEPVSAIELPTRTSPGLALMPSTTGHTFSTPLICAVPVRGAS